MLSKLWASLSGAKTYLVALATVVYGLTELWTGAMTQDQAMAFIFSGTGLAALRHGVSGSVIAIAEQLLPAVLNAVKSAQSSQTVKALALVLVLAGGLPACTAAQLAQGSEDATAGVAALCTDAATAAKDFPTSPVAVYGAAACPGGLAAASLVQNSATAQWLQTVIGQIQADKAAAAAPAVVAPPAPAVTPAK